MSFFPKHEKFENSSKIDPFQKRSSPDVFDVPDVPREIKGDKKNMFLEEWFGIHGGREVGRPYRQFINDPKLFVELFNYCTKLNRPCFISINPYRARNDVFGLEKLFFDFDSTILNKAWIDAKKFAINLQRFNIKPLLTFSGRKGFHAYVFLWRTVEFEKKNQFLAKEVCRILQSTLIGEEDYPTLDRNCFGDIKRLARVPFSLHEKSKKQCVPINLNRENLTVVSLDEYRATGLSKELFVDAVEKARQQLSLKCRGKNVAVFKGRGRRKVRPCILEALKSSDIPHSVRLAIAVEYLNNGRSVEDIIDIFRKLPKFDERITKYQVEHAKKMAYRPFTCSKLMSLGICLFDGCKIYRKTFDRALEKCGAISL